MKGDLPILAFRILIRLVCSAYYLLWIVSLGSHTALLRLFQLSTSSTRLQLARRNHHSLLEPKRLARSEPRYQNPKSLPKISSFFLLPDKVYSRVRTPSFSLIPFYLHKLYTISQVSLILFLLFSPEFTVCLATGRVRVRRVANSRSK